MAPALAERFQKISSIALPAADGTDNLVLSFTVPHGFDGVVTFMVNSYTGNGFNEGSGDLAWRVQINQRYPKDLGNILFTVGSMTNPFPVTQGPLLLQSDQLVQYFVSNGVGSLLNGGRIICSMWGYWYPRGVYVP